MNRRASKHIHKVAVSTGLQGTALGKVEKRIKRVWLRSTPKQRATRRKAAEDAFEEAKLLA